MRRQTGQNPHFEFLASSVESQKFPLSFKLALKEKSLGDAYWPMACFVRWRFLFGGADNALKNMALRLPAEYNIALFRRILELSKIGKRHCVQRPRFRRQTFFAKKSLHCFPVNHLGTITPDVILGTCIVPRSDTTPHI